MFTLMLIAQCVLSVTPNAEESQAATAWTATAFNSPAAVPFSFGYGDGQSRQLLTAWPLERNDAPANGPAQTSTLTWRDAATGLECRAELTRYSDFPVVEWVVYFKNTGATDTPILDNIQALDCAIPAPRAQAARLHYAKGSECRADDFAPQMTPLGADDLNPQAPWIGEGNALRLETREGRSSCGVLPFFNLDMNDHGVIGAIGWTGDWAATFYRTDTDVRMRAGMKRTHLKLLPGEEIRSPRMMLLFWQGDRLRGQNLLRQFILAHHTPQVNGKPAQVPISCCTWGGNYAENHIAHARWFKDQGLPMEYLWVDAGWFGEDEAKIGANVFNSQWGRFVGDWQPNSGYFPNGLKPVGDAINEMGMNFLLWLEPERVFKGTSWTREHPEWLLGPVGDNFLYNLGIPEACQGLADHLSKLIEEGSIDCYRQDFNTDPRPFWDAADAPDRVGISEIKHITGLYKLWDDLLARHPGLLIDNCSSGGRRIDLETISRSIPLWRTDTQCFPNFSLSGMQSQGQGLGMWVPLSVGCCDREDTYAFRSSMSSGLILAMYEFEKSVDNHFSVPWLKERFAELLAVRPYYLGDFYPLLSYSLADDSWAAWQYDRPDMGEGMVLAFRRPDSPFTAMTPKLHQLDPNATYELKDADTGATQRQKGQALMDAGLSLDIPARPGSKLLTYKRIQ